MTEAHVLITRLRHIITSNCPNMNKGTLLQVISIGRRTRNSFTRLQGENAMTIWLLSQLTGKSPRVTFWTALQIVFELLDAGCYPDNTYPIISDGTHEGRKTCKRILKAILAEHSRVARVDLEVTINLMATIKQLSDKYE